jgi:diacylglycerol kinase
MPIKLRRLLQSFKYAFKGIVYSFKEEQNIKIHFFIAVIVIFLAVYFRVSALEAAALVVVVALVVIAELVNTVLERVVDIIKPRMHPYAKNIKDMQAAVVLTATIASVVVGLIVFLPKILELFE